ncbi:MAG: HDOD domain-containing protein [Deltaproteobacteria bacterium]|nr:HDOD domain-containing protein [Deltaproteobacteria bacterium]
MSIEAEPSTRILFVDDEQAILGALQNLLRRRRRVWDMRFAPSGAAALEMLAAQPVDVVVSDLRMPGMDGATLLAEVRALQPWAVRLVLSGHAERDVLLRAASVAHQFLGKPCDVDDLIRVIERAAAIQRSIPSRDIGALAGRVESLPAARSVLHELERVLASPTSTTRDVGRVVSRDPGLSAKVLQLASSAFFGVAREGVNLMDAVDLLGVEALAQLTETATLFDISATVEASLGATVEDLQRHALETALVARALADASRRDLAFTAGLLHDIGRVVLAVRMPERLAEITQEARASRRPLHVIEREALGTTHAEVGAHLLAMWGLPAPIVAAVASHHEPGDSGEVGAIGALVQAAEALVHEVVGSTDNVARPPDVDDALLGRAGVAGGRRQWIDVAKSTLGLMGSVH